MRYVAGIVKWKKHELDAIDRNTRKVMTLNRELHPKSDIDMRKKRIDRCV